MEHPKDFFIFIDRTSMMTRHQYDLMGAFTSRCAELLVSPAELHKLDTGQIDLLPFKQNPDQYPFLSPFVVKLMTEQWVEYEAERLRQARCPKCPSRLSAIYAFGDEATCIEVAKKYKWNLHSVRRFELAPGLPYRAVRVNMEVVSLMRTVFRLATWQVEDADRIWSHYWASEGNLQVQTPDIEGFGGKRIWDSGVVWEWLIEGRLISEDKTPVFV
jgi:hypothetical protein